VLAVSFHEAAHAWAANRLGDPTAKELGRVTMNPAKHVDIIGSLVVPLFLIVAGGFMFGWAKPVPVRIDNLNNPKRDNAIVSAAGPASNLLLALAAAFLLRILLLLPDAMSFFTEPLTYLCIGLIFINVILAVFNLIPIPPLDGSGVLAAFLPDEWAEKYLSIGAFGMIIVLVILILDPLHIGFWPKIIHPVVNGLVMLFHVVAGIR